MVSIIVPIYNAEEKIERCITSILKQSYRDLEIILINDGSQDGSAEICKKHKEIDSRICYIEQENFGVSKTRNIGIDLAKGEFIQFVDCDDYLQETMVEKMVYRIQETQSDLVICGYTEILANAQNIVLPEINKTINVNDIDKEYYNIFGKTILNAPWNKLYRKDKIKEKYMEELSLGEDLIFNLHNIRQMKRISFLQESLYNYVINENGLNKKYRKNSIEIAELLYIESTKFNKEFHIGKVAQMHISNTFITFFFYGLTDLFAISGYSREKKKEILSNWLKNSHIQAAVVDANLSRNSQRLAVFFVQHKMLKALDILFCIKSFIYKKGICK